MSYLDSLESIKVVVTYLRVSTDAQVDKFSLPAQEKLTRELAAKHGWEIREVYRDEGYSGSWIEKRPAFFTLLTDAARRRFDAVVVTDFDRLTRPDNLKDLGSIQEVFIKHDIKIVTLSDVIDLSDDDQWFLSSLLGIVAAKEKKKLVARMKRGIQAKKEAGEFYGGIPPSGYCWDGEGKLKTREVTETYAGKKGQKYTCYDWRTVCKFIDLYLHQDLSLKEICQQYHVYFQTLVDILDRAWFYAGFTLQTRSRAEWTRGKKNARSPLARGIHPAIITEEEAKRVLEKRCSVYVSYKRTRLRFATAGLLKCGVCSEPMYIYRSLKRPKYRPQRTYHYYVCRTRHGAQRSLLKKKGVEPTRCSMPFVRADRVEEAAWRALETFLSSPQIVLDQVGNVQHQIALLERELEGIERSREDLARRKSNLIDLYEYGKFNFGELDQRMGQLKASEVSLDQSRQQCLKNIEHYQQRRYDSDSIYAVLGQIEEIIRFAEPEHRREIVRTLFREMRVNHGILELSAALPNERVLQQLSVRLSPVKGAGGVYQSALQRGSLSR